MASFLLFTDIIELHLQCGVKATAFRRAEISFRSLSARGPRSPDPLTTRWDMEQARALRRDLEARVFSRMRLFTSPSRLFMLDEQGIDIAGRPLRFKIKVNLQIQTALEPRKPTDASFELAEANPWAESTMDLSKVDIAQWIQAREARRLAELEAAGLRAHVPEGSIAATIQRI